MECREFLEGYSSFLDDLLPSEAAGDFEAHMEACEACARYDRVMRRGLKILRNLPRVNPPADFLPRLRHRIYHLEDRIPFPAAHPGGSAALVAVAAVGLLALAWLPVATNVPVEVELPAVAVEAPDPPPAWTGSAAPSLFTTGPFLGPVSRAGGGVPSRPLFPEPSFRSYGNGMGSLLLIRNDPRYLPDDASRTAGSASLFLTPSGETPRLGR